MRGVVLARVGAWGVDAFVVESISTVVITISSGISCTAAVIEEGIKFGSLATVAAGAVASPTAAGM